TRAAPSGRRNWRWDDVTEGSRSGPPDPPALGSAPAKPGRSSTHATLPRAVGTLLEVVDLQTHFLTRGGVVRAVDGVSWDVAEGETVALVGESGCGKSVSALSIMRLVAAPAGRIVGGRILFKGRDLLSPAAEPMRRVRGRQVAMIFQEPMTSLNPVLTISRQ